MSLPTIDGNQVVYFTELDDRNKNQEINNALTGELFYDGFIRNGKIVDAKEVIEAVVERVNNGVEVDRAELERSLSEYPDSRIQSKSWHVPVFRCPTHFFLRHW